MSPMENANAETEQLEANQPDVSNYEQVAYQVQPNSPYQQLDSN